MLAAEGIKVLYKTLNNISLKHSAPAYEMNQELQERESKSNTVRPDDRGLGRSPSPAAKSLAPVVEEPEEEEDENKMNNHVTVLTPADNERLWVCGHCNKSFGSSRALKIHEVKQHESSSRHFLKCGNCDEVFEHTNLLQIHMRVHHNVRLRCLRCKDMFDNPAMLRVHFKEHHSDPICLACGLKFDHDKLLRLHMEHYHKVGGRASKKDVMAFCEELSVKMATPPNDDVSTDSPPGSEGQNSLRGSLKTEEMEIEAERENEQSSDEMGEEEEKDYCAVTEKKSERQFVREDRRSPRRSPLLAAELKRDEVTRTRRAFQPYSDEKTESVVPRDDETPHEIHEKTDDVKMTSAIVEARNLQSQRPSVIATVSCSERSGPRTTKNEKAWDLESRVVREELPSTIHELRADSRSPALKDEPLEPPDDRKFWEEECVAFEQDKLMARRPAPRCNRCQQSFPSKMEYLHHLISHQNEESRSEGGSDQNDTENHPCDGRRLDFRGVKRWSVPDIRRPVPGFSGRFSELHAVKRHSVPEIRPYPVQSDSAGSRSRGVYGTVACSECMDVFFDSRSCKIHIEKCHTKPECRECGLRFDHKNLHKIHMNSYHSTNPLLQCYHCGQQFKERAEFVSHVTSHEKRAAPSSDAKSPERVRDIAADRSANVESEILGRESGSPRHSEEADESRKVQREERRETRTRIFMPQFRDVQYESRQASRAFSHLDGEQRLEGHTSAVESQLEKCSPQMNGLVNTLTSERPRVVGPAAEMTSERPRAVGPAAKTTSERPRAVGPAVETTSERPRAVSPAAEKETQPDDRSIVVALKPSQDYKADSKIGAPPPLIPVRQSPTTKTEASVDERNSVDECGGPPRAFQPHRLSQSRISAVPVDFRPSGSFLPWGHMKGRDGAAPEVPKNMHMVDVQHLSKEALLNSLCLRRRASAPELTGLYRPKLVESVKDRNAVAVTRPSAEPDDEEQKETKMPDRRGMNVLPTSTSFRARQMAMSYQPRRSQPGDFTCQRCGIFFGHKKLLKIHLDSYHGNNQSLQCLQCNRSFDDRAKFLDHVVAHQDGGEIPPTELSNLQRRKRSAPEVALRSSTARLESLYNKAIMNSKRARLDNTEKDSARSEDPSSSRSVSPRSDEDVPSASRQEVDLSEGDEEAANFCFVCGKSFESGKELDQHVSSHAVLDGDGRYCCSLCQKTFDNHRKLEIHTRSHTGFKPHKCEYCGRCFPYYSSYYYHKMTHTDQRPHKCAVCGKGFIQARYLRAHLKNHKEGDSAPDENMSDKTEKAKEGASQSEGLVQIKIELNDHHQQFMAGRIVDLEKEAARDSERHGCANDYSGETKSDQAAISEAEIWNRRHRVGVATKHESAASETTSVEEEGLNSTQRVCLPDTKLDKVEVVKSKGCKPVVMVQSPANGATPKHDQSNAEMMPKHDRSGAEVTHKHNRSEPEATPKPGKRYQCKHCQKLFSSYSSLHVHKRKHTGHRPYTCKYCNKPFAHASGMKRHVRCHTGERPYPCTYCSSAFADRGALRSHIRTHTGERPYKCDLCEKTFTQSSSLRVHKKTVHMQNRGAV